MLAFSMRYEGPEEFSYRARAWLPTLSAGLTARENILDDLREKANKMRITMEATETERGEWLACFVGKLLLQVGCEVKLPEAQSQAKPLILIGSSVTVRAQEGAALCSCLQSHDVQ